MLVPYFSYVCACVCSTYVSSLWHAQFSRSVSQGELSGLKESVSSWTASGEDVGGKEADQTGGKALSLGPHPLGGPSTSGVVKGPIIGPMIGPIPQVSLFGTLMWDETFLPHFILGQDESVLFMDDQCVML